MVQYLVNAPVHDDALNELFSDAWPDHKHLEFGPLLEASLLYVVAYQSDALVGFVRVVSCGRDHGIVFGPTVRPVAQRQRVGTSLLNEAASAAHESGVRTLHVEFAASLRPLYAGAGFQHTAAGVRRLP